MPLTAKLLFGLACVIIGTESQRLTETKISQYIMQVNLFVVAYIIVYFEVIHTELIRYIKKDI